jgi:hypothetical protein
MRQILETEEHVQIPPQMYSDPFYRITYLIKEEIRKYKWTEGERGRKLSWEQARQEWIDAYRDKFEKFLLETLYLPEMHPDTETARDEGVAAAEDDKEVQASESSTKVEPPLPRDTGKENAENPALAKQEKVAKEITKLGTKEAIHRLSSGQV